MMDDLRDYRFYCADMLHPSELAVDIIYRRLLETFLEGDSDSPKGPQGNTSRGKKAKGGRAGGAHGDSWEAIEAFESLARALEHRPLGPSTPEHRRFAASQLDRIEALARRYPYVDLELQRRHFESYLAAE
mmetsp:Transcript_52891/g.120561  ORF Transcript_52891/g.120561 Transcript_52891/m.120561 type:complete len:131 (-) Transcript_52891:155-547(-)